MRFVTRLIILSYNGESLATFAEKYRTIVQLSCVKQFSISCYRSWKRTVYITLCFEWFSRPCRPSHVLFGLKSTRVPHVVLSTVYLTIWWLSESLPSYFLSFKRLPFWFLHMSCSQEKNNHYLSCVVDTYVCLGSYLYVVLCHRLVLCLRQHIPL